MGYTIEVPKDEKPTEEKVPVTIVDPHGPKTLEVWRGYRLWDAMLDSKADFWKLCGGDGVCGTCRVVVTEGAENLSPKTTLERTRGEHKPFFFVPASVVEKLVDAFWWAHGVFSRPKEQRLACQAYVLGPCRVEWRENTAQKLWKGVRSRVARHFGGGEKAQGAKA
jgi:ferredoxin